MADAPSDQNDASAFARFQREETALILLNLAVLASLFFVHALLFLAQLGPPGFMLGALALRFLMQAGELAFLQLRSRPLAPSTVERYAHFSVWAHLAFGWLLTFSGDLEQRHAVVLFLLPITAAAFRFPLVGTLGVALLAGGQAFFEVWWNHRLESRGLQTVAYFEAGTLTMAYIVAAVVVSFLGGQVRNREEALARNLAELESTQAQLVEREKLAAVGRLASSLAHEVRNPVAMISSSLDLATDTNDSARQTEMLTIAHQELKRLEELTTSFLRFARVPGPQWSNVDLVTTLDAVRALATAQARRVDASIVTHVEGPALARVDAFQLQQILLNLVANAIQAATPSSEIRLAARRAGGMLVISVENAGAAIPEDFVGKLFEPFFTTRSQGTGLGLAIARRQAEGMGGQLALVINGPDRVVFELKVPQPGQTEIP
jgi:signal transduction histidine kinase